jgi:hypothetical protein
MYTHTHTRYRTRAPLSAADPFPEPATLCVWHLHVVADEVWDALECLAHAHVHILALCRPLNLVVDDLHVGVGVRDTHMHTNTCTCTLSNPPTHMYTHTHTMLP